MNNKTLLTAVGDIGCRIEENAETFDGVRELFSAADLSFGSLNELLSPGDGVRQVHFAGLESGDISAPSGWLPSKGKGADVLKEAGLDVLSFACTRALNLGDAAMLETLDCLKERGIDTVGAGRDLETARQPVIRDVNGTKIGFLAYCSSVDQGPGSHDKGEVAGPHMPGIVPLRAITYCKTYDLHPGIPPQVITEADPHDLKDMRSDITALRSQVDVLVVSMHWGVHWVPELIADYQKEVAHAAIDAGADLILGHHPHILKGVEVYQGKAIFYSLGNFSMRRPADFSFRAEEAADMYWITRKGIRMEVDPAFQRYPYDIDAKKSMVVKAEIADGRITRVSYVPLWLEGECVFRSVKAEDERFGEHLRYLRRISGSQGLDTKFRADGDEIVLVL